MVPKVRGVLKPLAPVLRGEGYGVRGSWKRHKTPHPRPLSPEYRGEGRNEATPRFPSEQSIKETTHGS